MPINNIPGVGPTNADIATAVAAPSAATIAAAVAAPSAATIAAAVAAPSAATIASAVAAPSAATITSIVQNNANPSAWTMIANQDFSNSTSVTINGLSSYKKIKCYVLYKAVNTNSYVYLRINGDSGPQYLRSGSSTFETEVPFTYGSNTQQRYSRLDFDYVNIASPKMFTYVDFDNPSTDYKGLYNNPNALSSFQVYLTAGSFGSTSKITVWGQ